MRWLVENVPVSWGLRAITARLDRQIAADNAQFARQVARPGEPHAKARRRIVEMQERVHRAVEHALIYGTPR